MKKLTILLLLGTIILMSGVAILSAEQKKEQSKEIKIGKVYFPRAYVHNGQEFNKGVYFITLKLDGKAGPSFDVFNKKKELLFNELAIVKKYEGKSKKFNYRFSKEMLRGYEYFRVRVKRPDNVYLGYFLVESKKK